MLDNSAVWIDVKCDGEKSGEPYFGKFRVKKYLTRKEAGDAERLGTSWTLGMEPSDTKDTLKELAVLHFHVVETDALWWGKDKGLSLLEDNPIWAITLEIRKLQQPKKEEETPNA